MAGAGKKRNRRRKNSGRRKRRKSSALRISIAGRNLRIDLHYLRICLGIILAAVLLYFGYTNVVFGSYNGMGNPLRVKKSAYSASGFSSANGRIRYEDRRYRSVPGIDVSAYQGDVDWEKVKASGVDFVIIRLGYRSSSDGSLHEDERYRENLKGAASAGLNVGVYFFSQAVSDDEAVKEAKFVIRRIRGKGVSYPVAYDMEPLKGSRMLKLKKKEKTEAADAFCTIIKKNGYKPMVYGNPTWLNRDLDMRYLTRYSTWLAHYTSGTDYAGEYKMWQYSDRGKVSGIKGRVDLDIFFMKK